MSASFSYLFRSKDRSCFGGAKKTGDERIGNSDLDSYPDEFLLGTFVVTDEIYFSNFSNFWAYFEDVFFRPPKEREIVDLCPE